MADEKKTCRELDEQFAPYVDGEAPPAARRAVEAHLAACPPCLERAGDERSARDVVVEHRGELRAAAPPALRARCLALSASAGQAGAGRSAMASTLLRRWAPLSLAATLVLAVAGVFVFGLNDRVEALAASLAIDHVKCFKVEGNSAHADALVAARDWEHKQGWPIVVPQSEPAQQLTLLDVRRCFTTDGRSAHMMYTWRGAPLSLYVLPEDIGAIGLTSMGAAGVIWCANRRTYAVVADGHPQDLSRVIAYMKAHAR
jgi:anti-sigma factor (TIGR02949 family)